MSEEKAHSSTKAEGSSSVCIIALTGKDAPVIGKPTIFTTDNVGEKIQWAQCEDCSKWRKLPADALLSSRWTCSNNTWDPERSLCSAAQEVKVEQIDDLLPANNLGMDFSSKILCGFFPLPFSTIRSSLRYCRRINLY